MARIGVAGGDLRQKRCEKQVILIADQQNFHVAIVTKYGIQVSDGLKPAKTCADYYDAFHGGIEFSTRPPTNSSGCAGTLRTRRQPRHTHFPTFKWKAGVQLLHRDAVIHWADQRTQVAANAFVFDDSRHVDAHSVRILFAVARDGVRLDALVGTIFAGDVAKLAADAEITANLGDDLVVQVEVAPIADVRHGAAAKIRNRAKAVV